MTPFACFYDTKDAAIEQCVRINRTARTWRTVVVDGPADNWAVVDIDTAIDMDMPYTVCG